MAGGKTPSIVQKVVQPRRTGVLVVETIGTSHAHVTRMSIDVRSKSREEIPNQFS